MPRPHGGSVITSADRSDVSKHRLALAYSDSASAWLDALRWVAALSVLLTHVQNRMLVRFAQAAGTSGTHDYLHAGFVFASGFGRQGVLTFFVLSGYLVGGGCIRSLRRGTFDIKDYVFKRLTRLTPVLVPALLATLIANLAIARIGAQFVDRAFWEDALNGSGPATFVCNMLYLQTALCPTYGGNGSLWSLFNEFWYYAVAGLLACAYGLSDYRFALAGAALLVGLTLIQAEHNLFLFFVLWSMGAAAAAWPDFRQRVPKRLAFALYVGIFLADRIFMREEFNLDHSFIRLMVDYAIAFALCVFLISLRDNRSAPFFPPFPPRLHQELAAFSFSLYCLNVPLINLTASLFEASSGIGWRENPAAAPFVWIVIASCMTITVLTSFAFSLATERRTPALRRLLGREGV